MLSVVLALLARQLDSGVVTLGTRGFICLNGNEVVLAVIYFAWIFVMSLKLSFLKAK